MKAKEFRELQVGDAIEANVGGWPQRGVCAAKDDLEKKIQIAFTDKRGRACDKWVNYPSVGLLSNGGAA